MLSLNSLGNLPTESRLAPETKAKARPSDEQKSAADFSVYMAALVQPVKAENPAPVAAKNLEVNPAEKTTAPQNPSTATANTEAPVAQVQKAGSEAPAERSEAAAAAAKDPKTERDGAETKAVKAQPMRSDKELLEALGLISRKSTLTGNEAAQKTLRADAHPGIQSIEQQKTPAARADKSQSVASTLQQLQKTPDLILANADGLKRLGEKLGLVFLGKVGEKLGEKSTKADTTQTSTKSETKAEITAQLHTTRVQKAGEGSSEQSTAFQNNTKSAKSAPMRIVSRETLATDTAEKPTPLGGSDLKPVSLPETATGRLQVAVPADVRLAESVSNIREAANVRAFAPAATLTNQADLVRQFSEIMGRAQVLVADSQNAQFTVKLYPREIGRMEIDLKLVEGEIRGKIVVENEDVKNEMQNFLQQREASGSEQQLDLNRIDIEVRNGNQNAQNPERTPDAESVIQNLVTRAATSAYEQGESATASGSVLYA